MIHTFYNLFIKPVSKDSDEAEWEIVLNYLLVGILALSLISFIVTLIGPLISHVAAFPNRLLGSLLTVLFVVGLYATARYLHHYKTIAILLTVLVAFFGCFVAVQWSLLNTHGILLLSLSVVMAGILIGARYSLYMTCALTVVLIVLQQGEEDNRLHPDLTWLHSKPIVGDVLAMSAILFVIAFVSWLFNRQMERSLKRARRSEKALQRQKALLEIKVEKRARQLEEAQLEKMQQLYRFAELGRLSTALFHDLANHLSTVSLDIEGLSARDESDIMKRISQNVGHIDDIVKRVREQIRGKRVVEPFRVLDEVGEVLKILAPTAAQARVAVHVERDGSVRKGLSLRGDATRFRSVVLNLIANAVEAYPPKGGQRAVTLRLARRGTELRMAVVDHGSGIPARDLPNVFRPFYTTKDDGVGIGLFIVKQVVENDFGGSIDLTSDKRGTTVEVALPKSYYARH